MNSALETYLDQHLDAESVLANYEFGYLQKVIEACFLLESSAVRVLSEIFGRLVKGFSFPVLASKKEEKAFVTRLLFSIYAQDFPLSCLQNAELLHQHLFQLRAACCSKTRLKALWKGLSPAQKARQLAYSAVHFDEGAFAIFQEAKKRPFDSVVTNEDKTRLLEGLQPYAKKPLTLEAIDRFVAVFGLYGHQLPVSLHAFESGSLIDKLEEIQGHVDAALFAERILLHIEALSNHPEWYVEGLKSLVHALPTCGKDLSKLYWLESTAASLQEMGKYINVPSHSIYVFDQSEQVLFKKNAAYIARLKKRYGVDIVHIGAASLLDLASRHNLQHLIVTSSNGQFGYGGARNAIFLLVPLLVNKDVFIHMGDDDVYVHPSLVFSDALWAYQHKDEYSGRMGYVAGRFARDSNFTKHDVLYATHKILAQCPWIAAPYPHGMSGLVSKPKLCLPLPFGQEENHMLAMHREFFDFRVPTIHLAGPRYPVYKDVPTSIFCGLGKFLQSRYVDVFQRLLVTELLDPTNRYNQCALPWNMQSKLFTSFDEMLECMKSPTTKALMQKQFWSNFRQAVAAFSKTEQGSHLHSSQALQEIVQTNWDQEFAQVKPVGQAQALRAFYREFAIQAAHYKAFMYKIDEERRKPGSTTLQAIEAARATIEDIEGKPLAYTLYLFCKSVESAFDCGST